jgi:hypothetical protein
MRGWEPPFGGLPPTTTYRGVVLVGQKSKAGSPDPVALTLITSTFKQRDNKSLNVLWFLN